MGQSTDDTELYYIQDTRQVVGNCVLWWAKDDNGYTCELSKAGLYTREQALRRCREGVDRAFLKSEIDSIAILHVRAEPLHRMASLDASRRTRHNGANRKLTQPQMRELLRLSSERQNSFGAARVRVQRRLVRMGLAIFIGQEDWCEITQAGRDLVMNDRG